MWLTISATCLLQIRLRFCINIFHYICPGVRRLFYYISKFQSMRLRSIKIRFSQISCLILKLYTFCIRLVSQISYLILNLYTFCIRLVSQISHTCISGGKHYDVTTGAWGMDFVPHPFLYYPLFFKIFIIIPFSKFS